MGVLLRLKDASFDFACDNIRDYFFCFNYVFYVGFDLIINSSWEAEVVLRSHRA